MAKQKTTKTPEGETPAADAAPAVEKGINDRFTRTYVDGKPAPALKADGTAAKLAPQLQVIVTEIEAAGEGGITRKDLVANLTGKLVTRQPVGRIVSYYQKDLAKFGVATHVKA